MASLVSGPVATMQIWSSGSSVISSFRIVTRGWFRSRSVTNWLNGTRSTAKAPPAGTRCVSADSMMREPRRRISSFSSPTAFSMLAARSELLHTNSANNSV